MRRVRFLVAAGAASLLSSAAFAADMPIAPPPQYYAPPPAADFGGWYLRGDIGFSNQSVKNLDNALYSSLTSLNQRTGFDSAGIYGIGVGYQFNNWLRGDITGEYRGKSNFHGLDITTFDNGGTPGFGSDTYTGSKSEWLFLANGYVDLGTWYCVTPFIGAGVGMSRNTISNFVDQGVGSLFPPGSGVGPSLAYGSTESKWNFAWALHAGLAYKVTNNLTLEMSYRYVNLGDGVTGDLVAFDGTNNVNNPMRFHEITSQDVRFGMRWNFDAPVYAPPPPPLVTKG
jgi:opacity protein-like surface antigen